MVRLELHLLAVLTNEVDEALGVGEALVAEGDDRAFRPGIDLLDTGLAAKPLDLDDIEEVTHLLRQRPEAVDQLRGEGLDGVMALDAR